MVVEIPPYVARGRTANHQAASATVAITSIQLATMVRSLMRTTRS